MANFSAQQNFNVIGLCQKLRVTDISDYSGNSEGITGSLVDYKRFTFRDGTGRIIKEETLAANQYTSEIDINLLTINISVELFIRTISPYNGNYFVQNGFLIPCLGI